MARRRYTKICTNCGKEYHPYHHDGKYCSRQCCLDAVRRGKPPITLTCDNCGISFQRKATARQGKSVYCSRECRSEHRTTKVVCETCGKEFTRQISQIQLSNFCSYKCAHKGMEVNKPILTCNFCGKEFERYPSEIRKMNERGYRHVFCSHKCRAAMVASQFDPPRPYNGFTGPTPKDRNTREYKIWRKAVFERDKYICQDCGVTDVLICAHHTKAYMLYPELRHDVSNGITLCYPCHEKCHSLSD